MMGGKMFSEEAYADVHAEIAKALQVIFDHYTEPGAVHMDVVYRRDLIRHVTDRAMTARQVHNVDGARRHYATIAAHAILALFEMGAPVEWIEPTRPVGVDMATGCDYQAGQYVCPLPINHGGNHKLTDPFALPDCHDVVTNRVDGG